MGKQQWTFGPRQQFAAAQTLKVAMSSLNAADQPALVRVPVYAVAFTGNAPPGAYCVVVPLDEQGRLDDFAPRVMGDGWLSNPMVSLDDTVQGSRSGIVLRPGESVTLVDPFEGVAVAVWQEGLQAATLAREAFDGMTPHTGMTLQVYTSPVAALGVVPVVSDSDFRNTTDAVNLDDPNVVPPAADAWIGIGPHVKRIAVSAILPGVPAFAAGAYELWWKLGGDWYRRQADDLTALGRGGVNAASHTFEVYETRGLLDALYIRKVGGDDVSFRVWLRGE